MLKSILKTIDSNHKKHFKYLANLLGLISYTKIPSKLTLLYRGSEHNFDLSKFHQLCDGKGPTLVIVRSTQKKLFGGYSKISWHSNGAYSPAPDNFIFSLDHQSMFFVYRNEQNALYGNSSYGPTFGGGHDFYLSANCNNNTSSYSNLGYTYSLPPNTTYNTNEAKSFLAGCYNFQVEEYEVFGIKY